MLAKNYRLKNRYRIEGIIGEGGMSIVYDVYDELLRKHWALKQLKGHLNQMQEQLRSEIELQKNLNHPALARIVDMIVERETCFLVMDLIDGCSLEVLLKYEKCLCEDLVVSYALELCDILQYLHHQGIIFHDLKPSNIMQTKQGKLMLIDFGIASMYQNLFLQNQKGFGTKGYAAPEQYANRVYHKQVRSDERSDIYALGATLYHLLSGEKPDYIGDLKLSEKDPSVSEGLDEIIYRCTRLYQKDRYQNIEQVQFSLNHYQSMTKKQKQAFIHHWLIVILCFVLSMGFLYGSYRAYLSIHYEKEALFQEALMQVEMMSSKSIYQKKYDETILYQYQSLMKKEPSCSLLYQSFMDYCSYFGMSHHGLNMLINFVNSYPEAAIADDVLCYLGELCFHGDYLENDDCINYQKAYDYFSQIKNEAGENYAQICQLFLSPQTNVYEVIKDFKSYKDQQPQDERFLRNTLSLSYAILQQESSLQQEGVQPYQLALNQIKQAEKVLDHLSQPKLNQRYEKSIQRQKSEIYLKQAYQIKDKRYYEQAQALLNEQIKESITTKQKNESLLKLAHLHEYYQQEEATIQLYEQLCQQHDVLAMISYGNYALTKGDHQKALSLYEQLKKDPSTKTLSQFQLFKEKLYYGKLIGDEQDE